MTIHQYEEVRRLWSSLFFSFFSSADVSIGRHLWDNRQVSVKFTSSIKITSRTPRRWFMSPTRGAGRKRVLSLSLSLYHPAIYRKGGKDDKSCVRPSSWCFSARTARMLLCIFAKRSKDQWHQQCVVQVALVGKLFISKQICTSTHFEPLRWR